MAHLTRAPRKTAAPHARPRKAAVVEAAQPIDYGPLSQWLGFHLRMAQAASFQAFARQTQEFEVRPGRFALLVLIGRNPGIRQTALSRAVALDKSTLTPALADLKRRGLIERRRDAHDKRAAHVFLTRAGERVLDEMLRRAARHEADIDRIVGRENKPQLMALLARIASELD
jgi:DNA-binding MarR family transcriptional regulator